LEKNCLKRSHTVTPKTTSHLRLVTTSSISITSQNYLPLNIPQLMPAPRLSIDQLPVPVSPAQNSRRSRRASLSQAERNVREVILSDLRVDAWYPSFYPEELTGRTIDRLFVCKWCFKYTTKLGPFHEHVQVRCIVLGNLAR
jgi:hypothetical protein